MLYLNGKESFPPWACTIYKSKQLYKFFHKFTILIINSYYFKYELHHSFGHDVSELDAVRSLIEQN